MDPTFLYNNYHLERRRMYEDNPRSNLKSSLQLGWTESLDRELSPKQKMERKRSQERRLIGERSNELIGKRLKKEIGLQERPFQNRSTINLDNSYKSNSIIIGSLEQHKKSQSNYSKDYLNNKDSLNEQLQLYNSTKFRTIAGEGGQGNRSRCMKYYKSGSKLSDLDSNTIKRLYDKNPNTRFSHHSSIVPNELTSLTNNSNFLSNYLNQRLEKYLPNHQQ